MKRMFGLVIAVSLLMTGCADEVLLVDSTIDTAEAPVVVSDVPVSSTAVTTVQTTVSVTATTTVEKNDAPQLTEEAAGYTPEIDLTVFDCVTEYDSAAYLPLIEKWSDRLAEEGFDKHPEIFCCVLGEYTVLYLNAWWQCDYAKAVFLSEDCFVVAEDEFFYGNAHLFAHEGSLFVHDYYLKNGYVHASLDEFDLKNGAKLSEYSEYYGIGDEITEPEGSGFGTDYASFDDVATAMHDMTDTIYKPQWIDNQIYVPQLVGMAGETLYFHDSPTGYDLTFSHAYGMQPTKPRYTSDWNGGSCIGRGDNEWYVIREGDRFGSCTVISAECGYKGYGYDASLYTQTITLDGSVTLSGILVKDTDNWLDDEHTLFFLPNIDDYAASGLPVTQKAELVEYQDGSTVAAVDIAVFAVGEQLYDEVLRGVTFDENGTAEVTLTLDSLKYNFCFEVMSGHGCNTARIVSASLKSEGFTGFDGGEVSLSDGEAVENAANVYRFDFGYGKASENAYYTEERSEEPHVGGKDWYIIRKGDKFGSCTVTSAECFYCYYQNSDSYELFHQDIRLDGNVTMSGRLVYNPEIELGIGHELFFLADTVDFAASGLPVTENSKSVFLRDGTMLSAVDVSVFGLGEGEQISAILDKTTFDERGMAEVTLTLDSIRLFYSYGTMSGSGFNSARVIAIDKY